MARAKENESRSRMNTVKKVETERSSESPMKIDIQEIKEEDDDGSSDDSSIGDIHGSWIRRRRLDGALNRVPLGFYSKIWNILESCHAIVIFDDKRLETSLTQEVSISYQPSFYLKNKELFYSFDQVIFLLSDIIIIIL